MLAVLFALALPRVSWAQAAAHPHESPGDAPSAASLSLPAPPADFSEYDAGWITLSYHPSLTREVAPLKQSAQKVKDELTSLLGRRVLDRVYVRVGRTPSEMATLTPKGGGFPKYASGLAYSELGLVLLTAEPRYPGERLELLEVFRHELAHVALHDALGRDNVPRWFNEGWAVHASGEAQGARLQTLWTATLAKTLLPLADLTRRFPADANAASIAYAEAADLIRFLLKDGQEPRFRDLLDRIAQGQSFDAALANAYSTDVATLESEWRADVARRYTFWPVLFGGSTLWMVAMGLFVWGYVKRKRRNATKLKRWEREEALEDARRELAMRLAREHGVHIVLASNGGGALTPGSVLTGAPIPSGHLGGSSSGGASARDVEIAAREQASSDGAERSRQGGVTESSGLPTRGSSSVPIPRVEHDGGWHTLH